MLSFPLFPLPRMRRHLSDQTEWSDTKFGKRVGRSASQETGRGGAAMHAKRNDSSGFGMILRWLKNQTGWSDFYQHRPARKGEKLAKLVKLAGRCLSCPSCPTEVRFACTAGVSRRRYNGHLLAEGPQRNLPAVPGSWRYGARLRQQNAGAPAPHPRPGRRGRRRYRQEDGTDAGPPGRRRRLLALAHSFQSASAGWRLSRCRMLRSIW